MHSPNGSLRTRIVISNINHSLYVRKLEWIALLVAVIFSFVFFFPSLRKGGLEAGVAFTEDALAELLPQFLMSGYYTSHAVFFGLDLFTNNGASEFFLRPNLAVYEPLVLLFSPIIRHAALPKVALMYMIIGASHAFACTYFTHRLLVRFLKFDLALATFGAVAYAFSVQILNFLWYLPHDLVGWLFPVMIYAGLVARQQFRVTSVILLSAPTFLTLVSGYVPMAIAATALAVAVIIWLQLMEAQQTGIKAIATSIVQALAPMALAALVVFPYYLALSEYHALVEIAQRSGASELESIAHDLAESPVNIVRSLSNNLVFSGPQIETTIFFGLVPLSIFVIYLGNAASPTLIIGREGNEDKFYRALLRGSLLFYLGSLLIVFGSSSVASDLFYYFVPILGYMHIYQRYLLITQFFLVLAIALMLRKTAIDDDRRLSKILILVLLAAVVFVIYSLDNGFWNHSVISGSFVVDLLMAVVFLIFYNVLSYRGVVLSATVFVFLTALQPMYRYSGSSKSFSVHANKDLVANVGEMDGVITYFHTHSTKAIVKYVDLVPDARPFVPKNLPWIVASKLKLSSYYGYDLHLGVNYRYRQIMGVTLPEGDGELAFRPDWEWLRLTGAEFAIFEDGNKFNDPNFAKFVDVRPQVVFRFSGRGRNFVIAPLDFAPGGGRPIVFDNGYIRIRSDDPRTSVNNFTTNDAGSIGLSVSAHAPAEVEYLFWPNSHLRAVVDDVGVGAVPERRLLTYDLAAGDHTFRMFYRNRKLQVFLIVYLMYGLALIAVGTFSIVRSVWCLLRRQARSVDQSIPWPVRANCSSVRCDGE